MQISKKARYIGLTLALTLGALAPSHATITFSLSPNTLPITSGSTVTFSGTIANSAGSPEVFLNQLNFTLPFASQGILTTDPTPFFTNTPLSLLANQSYTGDLFTVTIASGATNGTYFGDATLVGGATDIATDTLGTAQFSVTQTGVAAPEPATLSFMALGVAGGIFARKKYHA
jgi:hypothetical protein